MMRDVLLFSRGADVPKSEAFLVTARSFKHVLHVTILGACEWRHKSHARHAGNQNGFVEKFWCWSMKSDNMELTPEYGTSAGGDSFRWTDKFVGFMGATWAIPFSMLEGIWCKPWRCITYWRCISYWPMEQVEISVAMLPGSIFTGG